MTCAYVTQFSGVRTSFREHTGQYTYVTVFVSRTWSYIRRSRASVEIFDVAYRGRAASFRINLKDVALKRIGAIEAVAFYEIF